VRQLLTSGTAVQAKAAVERHAAELRLTQPSAPPHSPPMKHQHAMHHVAHHTGHKKAHGAASHNVKAVKHVAPTK
jgi:hypothetical protein